MMSLNYLCPMYFHSHICIFGDTSILWSIIQLLDIYFKQFKAILVRLRLRSAEPQPELLSSLRVSVTLEHFAYFKYCISLTVAV